jgi:hypothetical protein
LTKGKGFSFLRKSILASAFLFFSLHAHALSPVTPAGTWGASFLARPEVNDIQLAYSFHDRFALAFHGIRNHWPQKVELHYGLFQLQARLARWESEKARLAVHVMGGAGWANKLKGVDRLAHIAEAQAELETARTLSELRATTIGARDFDRKNFLRARTGFALFEPAPDSWKAYAMLHALYENLAQHRIEYGPMLNLKYRNLATAFYGNFKGAFSWEFSFTY